MKQIKVTIDLDGTSKVEAIGFTGTSCKQATGAIEKALGKVTKTVAKPEQFTKGTNQNIQRNGW